MEYRTDCEEWRPADFVRYIIQKLQERGITYNVHAPSDYIILGRLIKNFRLADKTKFALKTEIDKIFETKKFTYVNSLVFLWSLIKQKPLPKKEKRRKLDVIFFSDELRKKLRELKEEINAVN